jgi:hypothetical protein
MAGINIAEYRWIYKTSFHGWNKRGNLKIKSGEEFLEAVSENVISNSPNRCQIKDVIRSHFWPD